MPSRGRCRCGSRSYSAIAFLLIFANHTLVRTRAIARCRRGSRACREAARFRRRAAPKRSGRACGDRRARVVRDRGVSASVRSPGNAKATTRVDRARAKPVAHERENRVDDAVPLSKSRVRRPLGAPVSLIAFTPSKRFGRAGGRHERPLTPRTTPNPRYRDLASDTPSRQFGRVSHALDRHKVFTRTGVCYGCSTPIRCNAWYVTIHSRVRWRPRRSVGRSTIGRQATEKAASATQTTHNNNDKRYKHTQEGQLGLLRGDYGRVHGCSRLCGRTCSRR